MAQADDYFIVKMRQAGLPPETIASKMGITLESVNTIYDSYLKRQVEGFQNGYLDFISHFNMLCQQYHSIGESLKVLGYTQGNMADVSELSILIAGHFEKNDGRVTATEIASLIITSFIVLRPFKPISPEEAQARVLEKN